MTPTTVAALVALARLSPREFEVLALMARGASNATIAGMLVVSAKTLETHIGHIYGKLDLHEHDRATHRRIAAVLVFLAATDGRPGPPAPALERSN